MNIIYILCMYLRTYVFQLHIRCCIWWNPIPAFRSRGSTFRSRERPLGRPDSEAVKLGNLLCVRALILIILCSSKGIWWVLEQPMTSVMEWHPMFQRALKLLGMRKLMVSMGRFGGPTDKKTLLYSSSLSVLELRSTFNLICSFRIGWTFGWPPHKEITGSKTWFYWVIHLRSHSGIDMHIVVVGPNKERM